MPERTKHLLQSSVSIHEFAAIQRAAQHNPLVIGKPTLNSYRRSLFLPPHSIREKASDERKVTCNASYSTSCQVLLYVEQNVGFDKKGVGVSSCYITRSEGGREGGREGGTKIDRSSSWSSILHRLSRQATPTHRCWIRCCWAWQPWRPFWPWPLLESWRRSTGSTPPADPEVQSTLPSYASRLMQVQPPQCTLRPNRRSMTSIRTSYRTSMVSPDIGR